MSILNILNIEDCSSPPVKRCLYCQREKSLDQYPRHSLYKDNLDTRCKDCVRKQSKLRAKLHKTAPPKPEFCECCGSIPLKWCLDHDHKTNTFRGWICDKCNTGIGKLGDNISGLENAVRYLKECQSK